MAYQKRSYNNEGGYNQRSGSYSRTNSQAAPRNTGDARMSNTGTLSALTALTERASEKTGAAYYEGFVDLGSIGFFKITMTHKNEPSKAGLPQKWCKVTKCKAPRR